MLLYCVPSRPFVCSRFLRLHSKYPLRSINRCEYKRQFFTDSRLNNVSERKPTLRENIYTIPNLLTVSRILSCPVLAWSIMNDSFYVATSLLAYAGITDWVWSLYTCLPSRIYSHTLSRLTDTSRDGSRWAPFWAPFLTLPQIRPS